MSTILCVVTVEATTDPQALADKLEAVVEERVAIALADTDAKLISVVAIVKNSKGESHMDEYINQQVAKAKAYEDSKPSKTNA